MFSSFSSICFFLIINLIIYDLDLRFLISILYLYIMIFEQIFDIFIKFIAIINFLFNKKFSFKFYYINSIF